MKSFGWMLGASMTVLSVATGAASAQETTTNDSGGFGEVIVTAQKRSENLQDVPISIAAVSAETLERSGIVTLDAVQRVAPGMNMSAIGSGFVSYTYIRGAGTNVIDSGADPSVAFFVDEVYLSGTAGLQFDLLDVARVEVLKGPQGTLFGRNAAAGAISIITKPPEGEFNAWASADAGNYDFIAVRGGITGPISADGAWRYRLSGAHRERGAYTENPAGVDPGFIDNYTARGQLEYKDTNFLFRLTGDYFTSDNGMTNHFLSTTNAAGFLNAGAAAALPTDQSFYRRYYNVNGFERQDTYAVNARMEWDLPFATLTSITAYRDSTFERLQDQDGSRADGYALGSNEQNKTFSQELRLSHDSDTFHWILGAYYYDGKIDRADTLDSGPDFAVPALQNSFGTYGQKINTTSYAVFGQATFDFTNDVSLTLGGRYTSDKKESDQRTDPLGPVPLYTVRLTPDWDSFDPAAILQWQVSDDIMLYGSYRQGFKSGGFQSLPGNLALASSVYSPEDVSSYEVGVKSQWLDRHLQVNAALFRADISNQQILRIPSAGVTIIDNAGETFADGIDLSISALVTPNLRFDLNTTVQKARFSEYISNGVDFAGNHQLRSPDTSVSFVGEYTVPLTDLGDLRLRGEYSYQSDTYFDAANTSSLNAFQPSYSLVNARVTYEPSQGNWDISIFGKNLTDEEYFRNVAISGPSGLGTPGDPLTYGVSVNWRLN
jgi:iron complex outermembrane receptor protein